MQAVQPPLILSPDGSLVIDTRARLAWPRCVEGMRWSGNGCTGVPQLLSYGQAQALALAKRLYEELLAALLPHLGDLQESAAALAELDVLANLAERAETLDYRCPTLIDEDQILIEAGRHPVVEQVMTDPFIANPIRLERERRMFSGCASAKTMTGMELSIARLVAVVSMTAR